MASIRAIGTSPRNVSAQVVRLVANQPSCMHHLIVWSSTSVSHSSPAVASSLPGGGPGSCSSSTYIRSQYNLNPPPTLSPHSPEALPGYCPAPHPPSSVLSEGPPSTVGDFQWANTTTSSIGLQSMLGQTKFNHIALQTRGAVYKAVGAAMQALVVPPTSPLQCQPPRRTLVLPPGLAILGPAAEAGRGVEAGVEGVVGQAISSPSISRLVCTGSHNPSKTSFPKHSVTLSSRTQGCLCPTGPPL